MGNLSGKVAVVTGGGSGIGRALVKNLSSRGTIVFTCDINESGLKETRSQCTHPENVHTMILDVTNREDVFKYAQEIGQTSPVVDIVVNNAGISLGTLVLHTRYEDYQRLMDINLTAPLNFIQAFFPLLLKSQAGAIVNISSIFGLVCFPGQGVYSMSKFGIRALSECLREELKLMGYDNVNVMSVHPGGVKTNIAENTKIDDEGVFDIDPSTIREYFLKICLTTPEKAAEKIVRGILKKKKRLIIGADAWFFDILQRIFPTGYQRLVIFAGKLLIEKARKMKTLSTQHQED